MTFAEKATDYFLNLNLPVNLPKGITLIDPYTNTEVKKCVTTFYKKYFSDMFEGFGLQQLITEPTFPVKSSDYRSLIDLVFVSNTDLVMNYEIVDNLTNTCDHFGIHMLLNLKSNEFVKKNIKYNLNDEKIEALNNAINSTDWNQLIVNQSDINIIYDLMISKLKAIIDKTVPVLEIKTKKARYPKDIHRLIIKKRSAFKKYIKTKSINSWKK